MLHENDNVHVSWDGSDDDEKEANNSAFFCCTILQIYTTVPSQFSTYLTASVFLVLNERVTSNLTTGKHFKLGT
jgi:hypothetical protein